jgi:hypothetical protein
MKLFRIAILFIGVLMLMAFQNCSGVQFQALQDSLNLSSTSEGGNGEPYDGKLVTISHLPTVIDSNSMSAVPIDGKCSQVSDLELRLSGILIGTVVCSDVVNGTWSLVFDASSFADGKLLLTITKPGEALILASATIVKVTNPDLNLKVTAPPGIPLKLPPLLVGTAPFTYAVVSGKGAVDGSGNYIGPARAELTGLEAIDAQGKAVTFAVDFAPTVVNGHVQTMDFSGGDMFIGGTFNAHRPYYTPGFVMLDKTNGKVINTPCNFFKDLGSDVVTLTANSTHIFISTNRTIYDGQPVQGLIKVAISDCSLDRTFTLPTGFDKSPGVLFLEGNSLYVGGEFATYRGTPMPGLAKLDANSGNIDPLFIQGSGLNAGARVDYIVADAGAIYNAGYFSSYGGAPLGGISKINKYNGALDTNFSQAGSYFGSVTALHISAGYLYVGGLSNQTYRGVSFGGLAKLDTSNGNLDTAFSQPTGFSSYYMFSMPINSIASDANYIYVGGGFFGYRGVGVRYLAKLSKLDGSLDTNFTDSTAMPGNDVTAVSLDGGNLIVAGIFASFKGAVADHLMAVSTVDGSIVNSFNSSSGVRRLYNGLTVVKTMYNNGSTLFLTGLFDFYGGTYTGSFMKLKQADYSLDPIFNSSPGTDVDTSRLKYVNGSLFIATRSMGAVYRGSPVSGIFKVDATTGNLDPVFSLANNTDATVNAIETDGVSLFIGGLLGQYRGVPVQKLAKIDLNTGALDATFSTASAVNSTVHLIRLFQGALYIGGQFQTYKGTVTGGLIKLNPTTAALDTVFNSSRGIATPSSISVVSSLAFTSGGLTVGGSFSEYRGAPISGSLVQISPIDGAMNLNTNLDTSLVGFSETAVADYGDQTLLSLNPAAQQDYRGNRVPNLISLDGASGNLTAGFGGQLGAGANSKSQIMVSGTSAYLIGPFTMVGGKIRPCILKFDPLTGKFD